MTDPQDILPCPKHHCRPIKQQEQGYYNFVCPYCQLDKKLEQMEKDWAGAVRRWNKERERLIAKTVLEQKP